MRKIIILKSKFGEIVTRECNTEELFKSVGDKTVFNYKDNEEMIIVGFENIDIKKYL